MVIRRCAVSDGRCQEGTHRFAAKLEHSGRAMLVSVIRVYYPALGVCRHIGSDAAM